jgi:hypothetical protein
VPPDSPPTDVPAEAGTGGAGGSTGDGGSDAPADTTPACGTGCPTTIQGTHLGLWLAADFGVSCIQGHVTAWQDRGTLNQTIAPAGGKSGPQCGVDSIAGRPALFFDATGTDDTNGVLKVDLDSILSQNDYTVFVVERRQSDSEGYILGTPAISVSCDEIADSEYRFGYDPDYMPANFLVAGPYAADQIQGGCIDPAAPYSAYSQSATAAVDVEVFDHTVGHKLAINGTVVRSNPEKTPIDALSPAYIGRAFNFLALSNRHSRYLGDVAEIVIYNVALSDADRTAVEGYLKQRWNP